MAQKQELSGCWERGDPRARERKQICDVLAQKGMEGHWIDTEEGVLGIRRQQ